MPAGIARSAAGPDGVEAAAAPLPSRIANAIVRVYEQLPGLTHTQRQVLACLMRFGVKKDAADNAIYVKKATIARHLGLSEATIYRCLAALECASWIERLERIQTIAKLKVVGKIRLSRRAIFALGLDASSGSPALAETSESAHIDLASMRDVNPTHIQSSSKRQPPPARQFVLVQGKAVPADLAWLVIENALELPALFLLMRMARDAKQRLSDIVAATGRALVGLRGRSLFSYVRALIQKPIDYGHLVARRQAKAEVERITAEARAAESQKIADLLRLLRGQRHLREDGMALEIDEASVVIVTAQGVRYALPHERSLQWLQAFARVDREESLGLSAEQEVSLRSADLFSNTAGASLRAARREFALGSLR